MPSPSAFRYGLLLWLILCGNNLLAVGSTLGFDLRGHMEYIVYLVKRRQIPLATDGWQMFQSPLFYLIAAPFYSLFAAFADVATCAKLLRFISMLCGALQIEICYRAAKLVFPDCRESQMIATLTAAMLPLNLYSAQFVSNEPLAGVLTALTVYLCLPLICEPERPRKLADFFVLGSVWGLAMLAKVSPVVLAPVLLMAVTHRSWMTQNSIRRTALQVAVMLCAASLVAGWYYARNVLHLGRPFVGGWDQHRGFDWWQDPGYRNWSQLTSFGTCLMQPVYAGRWGLADSLYSTLWTDGFLSGTIFPPDRNPWNVPWLVALAWLGLAPFACIVLGGLVSCAYPQRPARSCLMFSMGVVGVYLFAITDLWLQLPAYCTGKSNYMLGAVPCLGLLAAAGAKPLMRTVWLRPFVTASLCCWAAAAYAAFFCLKPSP